MASRNVDFPSGKLARVEGARRWWALAARARECLSRARGRRVPPSPRSELADVSSLRPVDHAATVAHIHMNVCQEGGPSVHKIV